MILRILGCLLLLAAGLKLHGLAVEPVGRAGLFSQPWLQTAVIEWEIILGLWLVWGWHRSAAWLAASITFLGFAGVSLDRPSNLRLYRGYPSKPMVGLRG